jgi:hypothetical protein
MNGVVAAALQLITNGSLANSSCPCAGEYLSGRGPYVTCTELDRSVNGTARLRFSRLHTPLA